MVVSSSGGLEDIVIKDSYFFFLMLTRYTGSRVNFSGVFGVAHTYMTVDCLHSFYVFGSSYIINAQVKLQSLQRQRS